MSDSAETTAGADPGQRSRSRSEEIGRALRADPLAVFAIIVLGGLLVLALIGPWIVPQDGPNVVDVANQLQPPSADHWFGTDQLGRDILTRVVLGARISLQVGLISVSISLVGGTVAGLVAGYYRGRVDDVIMRAMDVLFAFPAILLAIAVLAILGPGIVNAMIAIGIVYLPIFARITRASVLSIRDEQYIRAARSIGASDLRVLGLHILPNVLAPIIVQTTVSLAFAILSEAALSFLGLGAQPPDPAWGLMLADARGFLDDAWWMGVVPGMAIFLTVLAFNLIGDALRDALDPRQRSTLEAQG